MSTTPQVVTLQIDGQDLGALDNQTILDVARENGIRIPTLCFMEGLSNWGACRLCLVEIAGTPKLLAACVTRVQEGMQVTTSSERLEKYRRMVLEMLFAERNHVCSVCVSNGRCELQSLSLELGLTHVDMPYRYPQHQVDSSHEVFRMDHNRCVLCTRCVRVCDEIEGAHTWDVAGRGIEARLTSDMNQPWGDSESCTRCGKCVNICPTGALSRKGTAASEMTKRQQFLPYLTMMRSGNED